MPGFSDSVVTSSGAALAWVKPSRLAIGTGKPDNLYECTALANELARFDFIDNGREGNEFWAVGYVDGAVLPACYLTEIGLYVSDPNNPDDRDSDILYAISVSDGDFYRLPGISPGTLFRIVLRANLNAGWRGNAGRDELELYTPLAMFLPIYKNDLWYGLHRHDKKDVDGMADAGWAVGDIRFTSRRLAGPPEGDYLPCDGREINLNDYPELINKRPDMISKDNPVVKLPDYTGKRPFAHIRVKQRRISP